MHHTFYLPVSTGGESATFFVSYSGPTNLVSWYQRCIDHTKTSPLADSCFAPACQFNTDSEFHVQLVTLRIKYRTYRPVNT